MTGATQVRADPQLQVVTVRVGTGQLALRAAVFVAAGIGLPAWAQAAAPDLLVPALLVTAGSAFWLVQGLTAVLVVDRDGVQVSASRRGQRRLDWAEVTGLDLDDGRLTVRTHDGRSISGPRADDAVLDRLLDHATALDLLPHHLR